MRESKNVLPVVCNYVCKAYSNEIGRGINTYILKTVNCRGADIYMLPY